MSAGTVSAFAASIPWTDNQPYEFLITGFTASDAVAIDATHGKLYVTDRTNNHVLRFAYPLTADRTVADAEAVFGASGAAGPGTLNVPYGLAVAANGDLWISDNGNHRVLKIPNAWSASTGAVATVALGQVNLTSFSAGSSMAELQNPSGLAIDAAGNLWVADKGNNRVLRFATPGSKATGDAANGVLGATQPLNGPYAVGVGGTTLWVADSQNNRVLRYANAAAKADNAPADGVLGQADFAGTSANRGGTVAANSMSFPGGVVADAEGRLYVNDSFNARLLIFNNAAAKPNGAAADHYLGAGSFTALGSLGSSWNLAYDDVYHRLILGNVGSTTVRQYFNCYTTAIALTTSASRVAVGVPVTFTATVTTNDGGPVATGDVTFKDGATVIGTTTLDGSGQAAFTTSALADGDHSIAAVFPNTATHKGSVTATPVAQVVGKFTPTVTLSPSANPGTAGSVIVFTATVAKPAGAVPNPSGTVEFRVDGAVTATVALSGGAQSTWSTSSLAEGTYTITANYSGDAEFRTATANLAQQVGPAGFYSLSAAANVEVDNGTTVYTGSYWGGVVYAGSFAPDTFFSAFRFDLTPVLGEIVGATLKVRIDFRESPSPFNVALHGSLDDAWTDTGSPTGPATVVNPAISSFAAATVSAGDWLSIDVMSFVQAQIIADNIATFVFNTDATSGNNYIGFSSRESASANAPRLEIETSVAPAFNDGATQSLTVAEDAAVTSINALLDVVDPNTAQTLTWSVATPPTRGALGGFPATTATAGDATPVMPTGLTYTPSLNQNGSDSFVIQVSDGIATDSITVNVTITVVNDAPALSGGPYTLTGTDEDTTSSGTLVSAILSGLPYVDPDTGASSGVAITASTGNGTWQYSTDGVSWNGVGAVANNASLLLSNSSRVRYVPDGANGETVSLTFRAWDQTSGTASTNSTRNTADTGTNGGTTSFSSSTAQASITITSVNDSPTANNDSLTVAEDAAATVVDVLANDTAAPDTGEMLTVTAVTQPATGGTVTLSGGVVRFTPSANFNGNTSFTYTISDGNGGSATASVNVTVTAVNDPPTANNDTLSVAEDSAATVVDVLANDITAPDMGETLTVSAVTQPATGGTVTLVGGVVRFTPSANFDGSTSFTYTISDGNGGTATGTVNVTVTAVNDPPTANNDAFTVAEDASATVLNVLANDSIAPDVGETLTIVAVTQPANGTVMFTASNISFTPVAEFFGTASFTYTISDGNGGTATATVTITVTAAAETPSVTNATTDEDTQTTSGLVITKNAADGAEVTHFKITAIVNGRLYKNDGTTEITNGSFITVAEGGAGLKFTPALNRNSLAGDAFSFNVQAGTDALGGGLSPAVTATITVTAVNDAPVVTTSGGTTAYVEGNNVRVDARIDESLTITDVDNAGLATATVSISGGHQPTQDMLGFWNFGAFGNIAISGWNAGTGVMTLASAGGTATLAQWTAALRSIVYTTPSETPTTSDRTIRFVINDGTNASAPAEKTVSVAATNDTPTAIGLTPAAINQSAAVAGATIGTLSSTDVDHSSFTYTFVAGAGDTNNALFAIDGSAVKVGGAPLAAGPYSVRVQTDDGAAAGTFTRDFTITVVDNVAPMVTGVTVPANGTYIAGQNLDFVVTYNEPVIVTGLPYNVLHVGVVDYAVYHAAGSTPTALMFRYTVPAGRASVGGITMALVTTLGDGMSIKDAAGNDAALDLTPPPLPSLAAVHVDSMPPAVISRTVPANGTYKTGQHLDFTVTYSENVTVNTGSGTPYLAITLDTGGSVQAAYNGGTGTQTLTFRYTVVSGNRDTDGIAAASVITPNGGTIRDAIGNDAQTTAIGFGATTGVLVDCVAPTVLSIDRQTPAGASTNASSVTYRVTFSEPVTGVDSADFTLTKTDTANGTIASTNAVSGTVYDIAVNTITGAGTLRLDLNNAGTGIVDGVGNAITTGYASGQSYTIDKTAPTADAIVRRTPATVNTNAASVTWRVTFDETVTSVDASDFAVMLLDGAATGTVASVTGVVGSETTVYDVAVNVSGQGALRLDLKATGTGIADLAGNVIEDGFVTGEFYIAGVANVFDTLGLPNNGTTTAAAAGPNKLAQRFTTAAAEPLTLTTITAALGWVVDTPEPVVTIHADDHGAPAAAALAELDDPLALESLALNVWTGNVQLAAGTTYWVVFATTADSFEIIKTAATTGGEGTWLASPAAADYVYRHGVDAGDGPTAGALQIAIGATSTPVVTSSLNENGTYGTAFTYQIEATNLPLTGYGATNLPPGLSLNTTTGIISGTPAQAGTFNTISLTATNASGTGPASTLTLTIGKAPLTVTANNRTRYVGNANPTFTLSYAGFRNGDTAASLTPAPAATTTATIASPAGTYPITPAGGVSNNYTFTYVDGVLTVEVEPPPAKTSQTITFAALGNAVVGDTVTLTASASSGLPVSFSVVSGSATLSGSTVTCTGIGTITVRAAQAGNSSFNAAAPVERSFTVGLPTPTVTTPTQVPAPEPGETATLTVPTPVPSATYQWQRNGADLANATTPTLTLPDVQPPAAGLYTYTVQTPGGATATSEPVIVGVSTDEKVTGTGDVVNTDVQHPNGNVYDQLILEGQGATLTADPRKITRMSFSDHSNDIVQIEFSGAGSLSLVMDDASVPAPPANYNQPDVNYVRGHVGIVITGADETTNLTVMSVGRVTAFDPTGAYDLTKPISETNDPSRNGNPLFDGHPASEYDGVANIAFVAIQSANGKFGGIRTGNVEYFAASGFTGIYAPGVQFTGPVNVGDIQAHDSAQPVLIFGAVSEVRITGGSLLQPNGAPVKVKGITQLRFTGGRTSQNAVLPAQTNQAVLEQDGVNVTDQIVVGP